ncbi:MAG: hypothetical protein LBQ12_06190 [Deltaproteobacteria bacterium]|jgi:hypothetical protein|nr:hypothetical protein [Deltaproteobacteria bacterium]
MCWAFIGKLPGTVPQGWYFQSTGGLALALDASVKNHDGKPEEYVRSAMKVKRTPAPE